MSDMRVEQFRSEVSLRLRAFRRQYVQIFIPVPRIVCWAAVGKSFPHGFSILISKSGVGGSVIFYLLQELQSFVEIVYVTYLAQCLTHVKNSIIVK